LQQQAERMPNSWGTTARYHGSGGSGPSKMSMNVSASSQYSPQFQPPPAAIVVDSQERPVGLRDVMTSVRSAAGAGLGGQSLDTTGLGSQGTSISTPPLAYTSPSTTTSGHRYGTSTSGGYPQSSSSLAYEAYDQRSGGGSAGGGGTGDMSQMYAPIQPHQYQPAYSSAPSMQSGAVRAVQQQQPRQVGSGNNAGMGTAQPQAGASFYASGVSPALGQSPYQPSQQPQQQQQQQQQQQTARALYGMNQPPLSAGGIGTDGRRVNNEMDVWSR